MKSIALIMPFFGKWPDWKDLFFNSCASNHDIDFFFFTDCGVPVEKGSNLHFTEVTFEDYCKCVSGVLGIEFKPLSPRKLCDLKPFYGVVHYNLIKDYDFWGFGDIDLVFGNIRKFYDDNVLDQYDVLSTHFDRLSGHLAIIRNNEYYRNLCFRIRNWRKELLCPRNRILDESEFSYQIFPAIRIPRILYAKIWKYFGWTLASKLHYAFVPFLARVTRLEERGVRYVEMNIHPHWTGSENWVYIPGSYSEGNKPIVYDAEKKEECLYCHFLPYKNNSFWKAQPVNVEGVCSVRILPQGICRLDD